MCYRGRHSRADFGRDRAESARTPAEATSERATIPALHSVRKQARRSAFRPRRHQWRRPHAPYDGCRVVDGGFAADGQKLVDHIRRHYGPDYFVNDLVLTHPDLDHATGLGTVLREMRVDVLWMNRPWRHVHALMPYFQRFQDSQRLFSRLRSAFEKVAVLEELALARGVQIRDAFEDDQIGAFTVLSPSFPAYRMLVAESDKTPVTNPAVEALRALLDETVSGATWATRA